MPDFGFGYHPGGGQPHPYDDPAVAQDPNGPWRQASLAGVDPAAFTTYADYQLYLGGLHAYHQALGRPLGAGQPAIDWTAQLLLLLCD